jgi:hypothetical protein
LSLDGVTHGRSVVTGLGTCGSSLDPGASCDVDVAYRPELAGETLSTVTVMTDAARWGVFFWAHGTATFDSGTNVSPATAILIDALPFGHGGLSPAQYEGSWNACPANYGSLWYRLKLPTKSRVELDPAGSQGPVQVMVMTGTSDSQPTICGDTTVTFTAEANVTYWIRVQAAYPGYQGQGIVLQAREAAPDVTVDASGFGVSVSTFYPIVDGYRDTVALKGTRFEKASVAISIYAPTGGKVRALSVATANGPWSVAWNGRTAAGTLLASGKYRIVQTVTDLWGNKLSATSYVTLSRKKLYTYTWSKTIDAGRYNAYGKSATGTISRTASSYAGGVKLATGTGTGSAAVGYAVTVPSATVYKTVTFQVLGRGNRLAGGIAETGVQDWTIGADWSVNNVDRWGAAPAEYGWAGIRVSGTHHVSNHVVRGYISVWVIGPGANKWLDARDVRFTVVYGVLK